MTTQVWYEHLEDLTRAAKIMEAADRELKKDFGYSDLEFNLPKRVSVTIDGVDTGWAVVYSEEMGAWAAEFGEVE